MFCLFLGGKPWLILHWGRFESQLSWRVRLQPNNDNFNDSLWKNPRDRYGVGASRDPCSEVFQGSHPFSEAESRALRLKNTHVVILIFQQVLAKFWFLAGTNCCNLQGLPAEPDASESSHLCSFLWQCPYLPLGIQGDQDDIGQRQKPHEKNHIQDPLFPLLLCQLGMGMSANGVYFSGKAARAASSPGFPCQRNQPGDSEPNWRALWAGNCQRGLRTLGTCRGRHWRLVHHPGGQKYFSEERISHIKTGV